MAFLYSVTASLYFPFWKYRVPLSRYSVLRRLALRAQLEHRPTAARPNTGNHDKYRGLFIARLLAMNLSAPRGNKIQHREAADSEEGHNSPK